MNRNVLAIAPHHDDECIGCGGLLTKLKATGWQTHVVAVFDPLQGGDASGQDGRQSQEAEAAVKVLGATRIGDLGLPCRESVNEDDIAWHLVKVIRSVQPSVLLIPHAEERDPEHRKTHRASIEAAWLSASPFRPTLGPPAHRIDLILGYGVWTPSMKPALTVDISDYMAAKLDALRCYFSQLEVLDLVGAAEGLARYWGALRGACR